MSAGPAQVHTFTRDGLAGALSRITLKPVRFEDGKPGVVVAEWMADALIEALDDHPPVRKPAPEPDPPLETIPLFDMEGTPNG